MILEASICDRVYRVECDPYEHADCQEAAHDVDARMRATRSQSARLDAEQVAVMVALNLSQELVNLRRHIAKLTQLEHDLDNLLERTADSMTELLMSDDPSQSADATA